MRLGLLSDIHGNVAALTMVLDAMREAGVDRILCAGDIVGYYYHPDECLDLLARWDVQCVRGNHENMFAALLRSEASPGEILARYGSGLTVAAEVLSPMQRDFLVGLPPSMTITIDGTSIFLCHGAPWDENVYVYPDAPSEVFQRCAAVGTDFVVLGHTHYQLSRKIDATTIINPGSVGQARGQRRGIANWAVLDVATGAHRLESTAYDTASVIAEARLRDPSNAYLRSILTAPA